MTLPSHVFSPGNLGMPYAQEINRYMRKEGLLIREHDVELGRETSKRFENYVREKPERIHTAPYLIVAESKREYLVWVNRALKASSLDQLTPKTKQKILNYLPTTPKPLKIVISVAVPVQGGEAETEYFGLGYTWIPRKVWERIVSNVVNIDWTMLDTRISQACFNIGEKALVHWDCVASHQHIHSKYAFERFKNASARSDPASRGN